VRRVVYLANPDNVSNMAALAETQIAASAGNVPNNRRDAMPRRLLTAG
jgi:hypothetical protein